MKIFSFFLNRGFLILFSEKKRCEPKSSRSRRQPKIFQKPCYDFQTSLVDSTGLNHNCQHWIKYHWKKDFHTWCLNSVSDKKQWSGEVNWCNIVHIFGLCNSYWVLKVDRLMQKNKHYSQWLSVESSASLNEENYC